MIGVMVNQEGLIYKRLFWAVLLGGALLWWWFNLSPHAALKDGAYECIAVHVTVEGKYRPIHDSNGERYSGYMRVKNDYPIEMSVPQIMGWSSGHRVQLVKRGNENFRATQHGQPDPWHAMACEWSGK